MVWIRARGGGIIITGKDSSKARAGLTCFPEAHYRRYCHGGGGPRIHCFAVRESVAFAIIASRGFSESISALINEAS